MYFSNGMKFTNQEEKLGALEALLFIHGEPMAHAKIAKVLEIEKDEIPGLLEALSETYAHTSRGVALLEEGDHVQLVTKPMYSSFVSEFLKEEMKEDLTPAALETLSLVTYLGPVSRAKIEYVRGVNSSFTLRNLRIRGLIDRIQDPASPVSYVYSPSAEFLRRLGVLQKENLPEYEKFSTLLEETESEDNSEKKENDTA